MEENIGEFEVPMHDLVRGQGLKSIQDLAEVLEDKFLREFSFLFDPRKHISSVAVLKHEIVIVRGLLQGDELDYMGIVAGLQYLDFVL